MITKRLEKVEIKIGKKGYADLIESVKSLRNEDKVKGWFKKRLMEQIEEIDDEVVYESGLDVQIANAVRTLIGLLKDRKVLDKFVFVYYRDAEGERGEVVEESRFRRMKKVMEEIKRNRLGH